MKYVISGSKMQQVDQRFIEHIGIPGLVLMERAALGVTRWLFQNHSLKKCLIVVGSGNNGADGLAVARQLMEQDIVPEIYVCGNLEKATEEFRIQYKILKNLGVCFIEKLEKKPYTVVIDAIFGVGLSREVQGSYRAVISFMNQLDCPVVSVDIPSGIDATTGAVLGIAVKANATVTFGFLKRGLLLYPGALYAGTVQLEGAGFHESQLLKKEEEAFLYEKTDLKTLLPKRSPWSNKGTYGKLLIIAGGNVMAGAGYLSARSAYVTGCGMVKMCTGLANRDILLSRLPELVLTTWNREEEARDIVSKELDTVDAVVFGPGMGKNEATKQILELLLKQKEKPILLDADALNMVADNMELLKECQVPVIITPHVKEFSRLNKKTVKEIQKDFFGEVISFINEYPVICVAKDARTIVAKQGETAYINISGNSGMATAGSGDVLSGIIGGLLAQGMTPKESAILGVYLHGLSGDRAKEKLGEYSMTAGDIAEYLHDVLGGNET